MASFLRPRRGKKATAIAQNIKLKEGEVFFECPDSGVGKGAGKIKVGDGVTPYKDLPYFMDMSSAASYIDVAATKIPFVVPNDPFGGDGHSPTHQTTIEEWINSLSSDSSLSSLIGTIKLILSRMNNIIGNRQIIKIDGKINENEMLRASTEDIVEPTKESSITIFLTNPIQNNEYPGNFGYYPYLIPIKTSYCSVSSLNYVKSTSTENRFKYTLTIKNTSTENRKLYIGYIVMWIADTGNERNNNYV